MSGHPLLSPPSLLVKWLLFPGSKGLCVLCTEAWICSLVLHQLASSETGPPIIAPIIWAPRPSEHCAPSLLPFSYLSDFLLPLSPLSVSLVLSCILYVFLIYQFVPSFLNNLWENPGTLFHCVSLPPLLWSLTDFLSRNPNDMAEEDRTPNKAPEKRICFRNTLSTAICFGAWKGQLVVFSSLERPWPQWCDSD